MKTIRFINSKSFSLLKKKAKTIKKSLNITHTEALEHVAKEANFDNWKQIVLANQRCKPTEQAFLKGCLFAFDLKEGMEFYCENDVFQEEHWVYGIFRNELFEQFKNMVDIDDEQSRKNKDTHTEAALKEYFNREFQDYVYFRLNDKYSDKPIAWILKQIELCTMWQPMYFWYKGKCYEHFELYRDFRFNA